MITSMKIQNIIQNFLDEEGLNPITIEVTQVNNLKDLVIIRLQILNLNPNSSRDIESAPNILIQELIEYLEDLGLYNIIDITFLFDREYNPILIITTY